MIPSVVERPIGVFDSGVGGLTVARAIADQLPDEALHYVGDTANGPYGPLPIADVRRHALAVMDELVVSGVKMLVIACNTATAACLRDARERYDVPVVEVVLPAVRRAMATTRTGRVGVIGTIGTITSRAYDDAFAAAPQVTLTSAACPRLAEFVERGVTSGRQLLGLVESYLTPIASADVDTLILGCTHYPLLTGVIATVLGPDVTLVSSAEETAQDVYRTLARNDLARPDDTAAPRHRFECTGPADPFIRLSRRFLGGALVDAAYNSAHDVSPHAASAGHARGSSARGDSARGDSARGDSAHETPESRGAEDVRAALVDR